jgi:hypothetical protein
MSERGARIVRRCSEITIAICRRSGGTGGSATVGLTRPIPYRLRRSRPRARRLGFQSLRSSGVRSTRQFPGAASDGSLKRQSGDPRKMDRDTSNRAKGGFATRAIHVGHRPADGSGALPSPLMGTARIARRADFSFRKSGPGRTPQRLPCPDHQPAHSAEVCRRALSGRHRARWLLRDEALRKAMQPPLQNDS